LKQAGLKYCERAFSLQEIIDMKKTDLEGSQDVAVFVTSSPFDILPVRSIDDEEFLSANNSRLKDISLTYSCITDQYVQSRMIPDEINHSIL